MASPTGSQHGKYAKISSKTKLMWKLANVLILSLSFHLFSLIFHSFFWDTFSIVTHSQWNLFLSPENRNKNLSIGSVQVIWHKQAANGRVNSRRCEATLMTARGDPHGAAWTVSNGPFSSLIEELYQSKHLSFHWPAGEERFSSPHLVLMRRSDHVDGVAAMRLGIQMYQNSRGRVPKVWS